MRQNFEKQKWRGGGLCHNGYIDLIFVNAKTVESSRKQSIKFSVKEGQCIIKLFDSLRNAPLVINKIATLMATHDSMQQPTYLDLLPHEPAFNREFSVTWLFLDPQRQCN